MIILILVVCVFFVGIRGCLLETTGPQCDRDPGLRSELALLDVINIVDNTELQPGGGADGQARNGDYVITYNILKVLRSPPNATSSVRLGSLTVTQRALCFFGARCGRRLFLVQNATATASLGDSVGVFVREVDHDLSLTDDADALAAKISRVLCVNATIDASEWMSTEPEPTCRMMTTTTGAAGSSASTSGSGPSLGVSFALIAVAVNSWMFL
jgi:hypothetical protein